jgi:O-antigen/teichoic acid export membrane protein
MHFRQAIEDVLVSSFPQIITALVGLVTSALVARGLGPAGVGEYALIISIPTLVIGLSDLGIGQTAIRYASKAASNADTEGLFSVLRWAFRLRMIFVLIFIGIFFLLAPFIAGYIWHMESLSPLIRLGLLIAIFGVISHIPMIYFQSLKRFKVNSVLSILQTFIIFTGILILAWYNKWSLELVLIVTIIANFFNALVFTFAVPKNAFIKLKSVNGNMKEKINHLWKAPPLKYGKENLENSEIHSFAFYMLISTVIVMITAQADIWLLGYFVDKSLVGIYNVAKNYTLPLVMLLTAVSTALWPRASAIITHHESVTMLKTTFKFSLLAAFGGIFYAIIAPLTIPWIFGSQFSTGILLGQILCFRYCIAILICPIGIIGYNFGIIRFYTLVNIIQFIAVISISILLLPVIGPMGSALALIANEIIGASLLGFILWRKIKYVK